MSDFYALPKVALPVSARWSPVPFDGEANPACSGTTAEQFGHRWSQPLLILCKGGVFSVLRHWGTNDAGTFSGPSYVADYHGEPTHWMLMSDLVVTVG